MPAVKPVIASEKTPVPVPFVSLVTPVPPMKGLLFVLVIAYTIPLSVILSPPSAVALPAKVADVSAIELAAVVDTVGVVDGAKVVKVSTAP